MFVNQLCLFHIQNDPSLLNVVARINETLKLDNKMMETIKRCEALENSVNWRIKLTFVVFYESKDHFPLMWGCRDDRHVFLA